ncbi:F-box protein At1g61340-like [Impatiens glandulifera]|uniref:F-box protein At1g61340-like n=1 Tax=Impatiens glandulifera TaxID=253017 RepID=UPI001FB12FEE|nr:F-box protein At1g61340-like [Impatiens glandulifera]
MAVSGNEGLGLGLGFISYTRSMSGKRIAISINNETESTPLLKKQCSQKMDLNFLRSQLEALPHDILMKILCGVDHDDLKQLFHVSKTIREVTLIARKIHFEYSTPRKILGFRDFDQIGDLEDDYEAPNAPKRIRNGRAMMNEKKLADISVALFA